jgi:hypothetical protein
VDRNPASALSRGLFGDTMANEADLRVVHFVHCSTIILQYRDWISTNGHIIIAPCARRIIHSATASSAHTQRGTVHQPEGSTRFYDRDRPHRA